MKSDMVGEHISPISAISESIERILGQERWHKTRTGGWIGDAIYGVNDGLGAIFGIIAGVAGYTANSQPCLSVDFSVPSQVRFQWKRVPG
ncbi:hypothetical protein GCM10025857_19730 [Alicyclobacillus contaminans]|nr:hypothetical protein GCM10025857_19730 [Alicyclobacillus contaminans]